MNALVNYLLEANLGLCLLMLIYVLLLRSETDFRIKRSFLLAAVVVSIIFPLIHFSQKVDLVPSLGNIVPPTWLPEVVVYGDGTPIAKEQTSGFQVWHLINIIYAVGITAALLMFLFRLISLIRLFVRAKGSRYGEFVILESEENRSAFSFFRFIYIGQSNVLSPHEKALIIQHEQVHARQLHSFDVLLMNALGIFFWFNPVINTYKKIFIQLHEFEADARAVENSDVDNYCSLLAKVALLSADFKLANHFSNSLTVKRIEMMRTLKSKIKPWKVAALAVTLPCLFFVIACQDQVNEITDIARNSTSALLVPAVVQNRYDELRKLSPKSNFIMLELNEEADATLEKMDKAHGIPAHIELFTPDSEKYKHSIMNTGPEKITVFQSAEWEKAMVESGLRTFAIVEYNSTAAMISEKSQTEGEIFTVVEQSAEYPGGMDGLVTYLGSTLQYPATSRMQGIEGTSHVQFVVNKDGSIGDVSIVKSLSPETDKEAMRVVSGFPNWKPGKQNGEVVRQRFVIPIKYKLGNANTEKAVGITEVQEDMKITFTEKMQNGKKIISGRIESLGGQPLSKATLIIKNTTRGVQADNNGNFTLELEPADKEIVASFVGFKSKEISLQ